MNEVLGIGIDLTQTLPVVSVCLCPPAARVNGHVNPQLLAHHWPPITELTGKFAQQPPVALLPLTRGEPLIVADSAAKHRRSSGLVWPPEAQVPFGENPSSGLGRIPLVAAWTAIVPQGSQESAMTRREDCEFVWMPEGERTHSGRAGEILARSIKAFLEAANVPFKNCLTAIVVPDALDEGGQQLLLDNLKKIGFDEEKLHLLPRPLAAALYWCQHADPSPIRVPPENATDEGTLAGRLRVLTMSLDCWEAQSFELRLRRQYDRTWYVPIRDRSRISSAPPELPFLGVGYAMALSQVGSNNDDFAWWTRLFASDWLFHRLQNHIPLTKPEAEALADLHTKGPRPAIRRQMDSLAALKPLWSRCFRSYQPLSKLETIWQKQEKILCISNQDNLATLATGSFALLRGPNNHLLAHQLVNQDIASQSNGYDAPARGAAIAAAAITHQLPCYRETLLPLDLFVTDRDEFDDLKPQWKPLVFAQSIEAGKPWISPSSVTGLQIHEGKKELLLPLRRSIHGTDHFRQVASILPEATKRDEPVRIEVVVKPGQGFAQVGIKSMRSGVFSARLDWRTMRTCDEPQPPKLTYLHGVSRIVPYPSMFWDAARIMQPAQASLKNDYSSATVQLRELILLLNKWPLAYKVERKSGKTVMEDFLLHYGVIGSAGQLDALPQPRLAREFRDTLGEAFAAQIQRRHGLSPAASAMLRTAGWLYLGMPSQCYDYLRVRLATAQAMFGHLSAVELHAIGLAFESPEDLRAFYPLAVRAVSQRSSINHWLRAIRNICRFRNHALHPDVISDAMLSELFSHLTEIMRTESDRLNFALIFNNCLESLAFLLKRRRYDSNFMAPTSQPARELIPLLEYLATSKICNRLATRLRKTPASTLNFLCQRATASDIGNLLGVADNDDPEEDND